MDNLEVNFAARFRHEALTMARLTHPGIVGVYESGEAGGLLSIVMVLGSLFPLMVVFLAFVVLHERLYRIQYLGIFLALLGVAIISSQ